MKEEKITVSLVLNTIHYLFRIFIVHKNKIRNTFTILGLLFANSNTWLTTRYISR